MEGVTAGDPMSLIKWTRKSTRFVSRALRISHTKAWRMLRKQQYRLRFNRKRLSRRCSPHRDRQFRNIQALKESFLRRGNPVISVDAKKRELVGPFKNAGRSWRRDPQDVNIYDFPSDASGVAIPYGIYDVGRADGFVVVGTSHNTPAFAGNAIGAWWRHAGRRCYRAAKSLLILADSGSSNAVKAGAWKSALQRFANRTGLRVTVAHYPTGASKWNPVEHRLFSAISNNWSGQPLTDYTTIRNLIRATRTPSGSRCRVRVDPRYWPTQKEQKQAPPLSVTNEPRLKIRRSPVLPELNYCLLPTTSPAN
jgi:Rhodopirellula transposase DDE domain